jgi:hypothetical protein
MIINQEAKTTPNAFGSLSMGEMMRIPLKSAGRSGVILPPALHHADC